MSVDLEATIAIATDQLKAAGFEQAYIDAAVKAYVENIKHECEGASKRGMRLAVSPLSKVTSIVSVDDSAPRESIGWQYRALHQDEPPPSGWVAIDQ